MGEELDLYVVIISLCIHISKILQVYTIFIKKISNKVKKKVLFLSEWLSVTLAIVTSSEIL